MFAGGTLNPPGPTTVLMKGARNMKIQKPIFKCMALLATCATCFVVTDSARANHDYNILRGKADAVFHSMVGLDRTLVDSYVQSCLFGDMMATSGRIKSRALYLRGMAWNGSSCQWATEIDRLDRLVHKLESQIKRAHDRAARGLDPPISYCSIEAGRRLAAVVELVHCMQNALGAGAVVAPVVPAPIAKPVCTPRGCFTPQVPPRGYDLDQTRRPPATWQKPGFGGSPYSGYGNQLYGNHAYGNRGYGNRGYGNSGYGSGLKLGYGGLGLRINF